MSSKSNIAYIHTKTSTAYRFNKSDPDPIVLQLRDLINKSGLNSVQIATRAMISYTTVQKIREVATRRPHNATVDAILEALGYTRKILKITS